MSMSNPALPKFFVYAPDKTEEGTYERRLSVRATHIAAAQANIAQGFIRVGGVLLTPESFNAPPENQKMVGSTFICEAESIDEVRKVVEEDIYYKKDVWDREKIVILLINPATPLP